MKKYTLIYSDPPWQYQKQATGHEKMYGLAERHYKTMTPDELIALKVEKIAEENCLLFLWATFRKLPIALQVMKAWGFEYKTLGFCWIKVSANKKPKLGLGYYTRQNAEIVLIGSRGKTARLIKRHDISSVIITQPGRHSAKPTIVRKRIEQLTGDVSKIELFAREKSEGWDSWGNEVSNDIIL